MYELVKKMKKFFALNNANIILYAFWVRWKFKFYFLKRVVPDYEVARVYASIYSNLHIRLNEWHDIVFRQWIGFCSTLLWDDDLSHFSRTESHYLFYHLIYKVFSSAHKIEQ